VTKSWQVSQNLQLICGFASQHIITALYSGFRVKNELNSFATKQQHNAVTSHYSANEHRHLMLNLTSVHQCIIDDTDELYHEFLVTDDEC